MATLCPSTSAGGANWILYNGDASRWIHKVACTRPTSPYEKEKLINFDYVFFFLMRKKTFEKKTYTKQNPSDVRKANL